MLQLVSFLSFLAVAFVAARTYGVAPEGELDLGAEMALDTANDRWTESWVDAAKQSEQVQETPGCGHHLDAEMTNEIARTAPFGVDRRIMGGQNASIRDFPYMVSVLKGREIQSKRLECGGSIISSRWVLTAAHCFNPDTRISEYTVRAGVTNILSKGIDFSVSEIIPHQLYRELCPRRISDYDIAVVKIDGTFTFTEDVQPVRLVNCFPSPGTFANVTGWGFTTSTGRPSTTLRALAVPILSQGTCKKLYRRSPFTPRMFCAGYVAGGKDACRFDSGGPLVSQGEQVGLVSWGIGCGSPNAPGVYTNLTHFRSWISSVTGV